MAWAEDYRQAWIAETLLVFGFIQRIHLVRKFGISQQQAAKDFARFQQENPGKMFYDTHQKCYVSKSR